MLGSALRPVCLFAYLGIGNRSSPLHYGLRTIFVFPSSMMRDAKMTMQARADKQVY
jgi:hypothetical protein